MRAFPARFLAPRKEETPEQRVQKEIIRTLELHGWVTQRNQQGFGSSGKSAGRPDLEAYRNGFCLFVEVKAPRHLVARTKKMSPGGKLSDDQKRYIERLRDADMTVIVTDDAEQFMLKLEAIEEKLWPGQNLKRLC